MIKAYVSVGSTCDFCESLVNHGQIKCFQINLMTQLFHALIYINQNFAFQNEIIQSDLFDFSYVSTSSANQVPQMKNFNSKTTSFLRELVADGFHFLNQKLSKRIIQGKCFETVENITSIYQLFFYPCFMHENWQRTVSSLKQYRVQFILRF